MGFISNMNKTLFLYLVVVIVFNSCSKKESKNTTTSTKYNQVAVIIDDELWNGEIGDTIRNKFASPVLGLAQEEPVFTLNQYPVKLFEGFMNNSRNIIVIKKENKKNFSIQKNEFANPQTVVHISGETVKELIDTIQNNDSLIINKIRNQEIKYYQTNLKKDTLINSKTIQEKFNITIDIPEKYKIVRKAKRFIWLKKEIISGNLSIVIYQVPINSISKNSNSANRIIKIRDSIGKKYIHGAIPNTKMITETAFSPYFAKTKIQNLPAFETKGTWELQHDYMNGPFINYAIIDEINHRALILEGFCYAPSKQKRDLMFELEAIIKTTQILKKQPKK